MNYKEARDRDLLECYNTTLKQIGSQIRVMSRNEIFELISCQPATQFYVSEREAKEKVSLIHRGLDPELSNPLRLKMYHEIYRRALEIQAQQPHRRLLAIVSEVIYTPAPCFYLTASSIEIIYNRLMRERTIKKHQSNYAAVV